MKNAALSFAMVAMLTTGLSAATVTVKVNSDGSFSPAVVYIHSGDTVEWTMSSSSDSIIPVSRATSGFCSAIKPWSATDPNEFTGPMPKAASGVFTLSPLEGGFVVEPARTLCSSGQPPAAVAGSEMLCRGLGTLEATLDSTWQDPNLSGVFIRLLWKELQIAPGTADSSFDFTILDREVDKAVKNGKVYNLGIKGGDDGTPAWLFTNGVTALQLQDSGEDIAGCGARMTLGNPTEIAYQNHYFDMLRKVAAHLKARADRYRALAYIKPSGANLFTHENRLPKRCNSGCVCNPQVFAQHGYTPNGLYAFYQAQTSLMASEFPQKTMLYALIQDGFPSVNNNGGYETTSGTSSGGGPLPGGTEQTQTVINNGQAAHGLQFAVAHNGLQTMKTTNCLSNINAPGCPNKWVLQEGLEGQVTGWQTTNAEKVSNAADTDSAFQNALLNTQGVYVEIYEERYWEAVRQPNGVIDPAGSGRTMAQWVKEFNDRRRALFPSLGDPYATTHRHTFTRSVPDSAGNQTFYYVNGWKCGNASPAAIVLLPANAATPLRHRVAGH